MRVSPMQFSPRAIAFSLFALVASVFTAPPEARGDEPADSSLAATTAPAWVPDRPVPAEEGWETALRFPMRVIGFPFALIGNGLESTLRYVEETSVVQRTQLGLAILPRAGVWILPASLGARTGTGLELELRPTKLGGVVGAEFSGSMRHYSRTRLDLTYGPARFEYGYDWRPEELYFGNGLESREDLPSSYATRFQHFTLDLGFPVAHAGQKPPRFLVGAWAGPREMLQLEGREDPSFDRVHPGEAGLVNLHQEHFVYGVRATLDQRYGAPHWSSGFKLAGSIERFDEAIEALAITDGNTPAPIFTRINFLGEAGVSFMRDPRTLRLRLEFTNQVMGEGDGPLLLPDLQKLGGSIGLFGFESGRFHDVDMAVARFSYIFPLARHLEMDLHVETGGVYKRLNEARFSSMERSYGFTFRPRLDNAMLGSFGLDWGRERVRFRYTFGGVE